MSAMFDSAFGDGGYNRRWIVSEKLEIVASAIKILWIVTIMFTVGFLLTDLVRFDPAKTGSVIETRFKESIGAWRLTGTAEFTGWACEAARVEDMSHNVKIWAVPALEPIGRDCGEGEYHELYGTLSDGTYQTKGFIRGATLTGENLRAENVAGQAFDKILIATILFFAAFVVWWFGRYIIGEFIFEIVEYEAWDGNKLALTMIAFGVLTLRVLGIVRRLATDKAVEHLFNRLHSKGKKALELQNLE